GAGGGANRGGARGIYLGILVANLAAGTLAWWYARHRFEQLCHQGRP
ncbi:MATE family efflux transporter, partial [Aeromonas hydrophila]